MIKIINQKKKVSFKDAKDIVNLIKKENPTSILAHLSNQTLIKIINFSTTSKNEILFLGKVRKKVIAYAWFIRKIDQFYIDHKQFVYEIILKVILSLNLNLILLLIISYFKLDIIFLPKKSKKLIDNSLNLHLLAVNKKNQNKGIGTFFLKKIINSLKNHNLISLEAFDHKAIYYYKKKFNFKEYGSKIRFGYFYKILIRKQK